VLKLSFILILASLTGCAGWPPDGRGGMAEHHMGTLPPVMPDQPLGPEHGLRFELELVRQHLDILVLEGAELCFPATVIQAKQRQNRITRELQGDLDFDAANDLVIQRKLLARLERQLDYVKQQSICIIPVSNNLYENNEISNPDENDSEELLSTKVNPIIPGNIGKQIYELLNTDNQFAFGSSELNPKYIVRLAEAAQLLNNHPDYHLEITGHADVIGDKQHNVKLSLARAKQVGRYLKIMGLAPERIEFDAVGSDNPLFDGKESHIRLVNRRVSIELIDSNKPSHITTEQ